MTCSQHQAPGNAETAGLTLHFYRQSLGEWDSLLSPLRTSPDSLPSLERLTAKEMMLGCLSGPSDEEEQAGYTVLDDL